jgi:hypothetical protein
MQCIEYKSGYKYQLKKDYAIQTDIKSDYLIKSEYLMLTTEGRLIIKNGYAWDGPSGPTIDTLNFMRGSLVHDAFYQLMRERYLDNKKHREPVDRLLQKICREDGMSRLRAWWVYQGVRLGGGPAADPANDKPIIKAPEGCQ